MFARGSRRPGGKAGERALLPATRPAGTSPPREEITTQPGARGRTPAVAEYVPKFGRIETGGAGTEGQHRVQTVPELPLRRITLWKLITSGPRR